MYEMSERHPVWVAENQVNPCNSVPAAGIENGLQPITPPPLHLQASIRANYSSCTSPLVNLIIKNRFRNIEWWTS